VSRGDEGEWGVKVKVRCFAPLSRITGAAALDVEVAERAGLMDVVAPLADRFGPRFVEALYAAEYGPVDPYTSVIVDGRAVLLTERASVALREGSTVAFVPPLGGG
jgi:molybdopterin converting factor small subunit